MRNLILLFLILFASLSLSACQPQSGYVSPPGWKYADLRALDPADDISPSLDLLALYIRPMGEDLEIRLDLMDLSMPMESDLQLWISFPSRNEIVYIDIPATGEITAHNNYGEHISGLRPRVARDTFLDTVVVSLDRSSLLHNGLPFWVKAFSRDPADLLNGDQIGWVRSDASPPPQAEVLFTFWNTFPAATPAQALRLWDGAHSGPGRSRYGLHHLLNAVKSYNVPVFLLDLKASTSLSILDFMGVLPEVKSLADLQLVTLPDVTRFDLPTAALSALPDTYTFELPTTPFLYTSAIPDTMNGNYQVLFVPSDALGGSTTPTDAYRWQGQTVIPISSEDNSSTSYFPTSDGPSLALRRRLVQATFDSQRGFFLLGGKLVDTAWGDPASVAPTLRYLTAHPWIRFLSADDLLNTHPNHAFTPETDTDQPGSKPTTQILTALKNATPNPITEQAWQTFLSLLTPASSDLPELRAGYFGIVGHLLTAAHWAARPSIVADCTVDIDWDEQPECILSSLDFFATFEPSGGYIVAAFVRRADGVHQIIAPYGQFVVGLGDPSIWDPSQGSQGDPALVPGGFVDDIRSWTPQVQAGQITFTNPENNLTKTFRLTESGLRVEYNSASALKVKIALGLDPWRRFTTGWGEAYHETILAGSWKWVLETGTNVTITTSGELTAHAFNESRDYLMTAEDPNFDYPAGHYIPFPLALVEINGQDNFFIQMDIR